MRRLANLIILTFPLSLVEGAGDGVKVTAEKVFSFGNFPITNSMVTSWVISLFLVLFKLLVGKPQIIPSKGQLILESVIGGIRGIIEPIVGKSIFPFILAS